MNFQILVLSLLIGLVSNAHAGQEKGGGDPCERRIQEIRDDLSDWIKQGGPSHGGPDDTGLKFTNGVTADIYSQKMSQVLAVTSDQQGNSHETTFIECVHQPVEIQGEEKVCRFDEHDSKVSGPKITCYYEAFLDKRTMDVDEQYRLIHHEYAGLAGLETPDGPKSQYLLSNQIVAKLGDQVVKKLVVGRDASSQNSGDSTDGLPLENLPAGSTISVNVNQIIEAGDRGYELGSFSTVSGHDDNSWFINSGCSLGFPASSERRNFSGTLIFVTGQLPKVDQGSLNSPIVTWEIAGTAKLNGRVIPGATINCNVNDDDASIYGVWDSLSMDIGDLRKIVAPGTLILPPPQHF